MRFVFRADGNSNIGLGHITRCLALADILKRYGVVEFISKDLPIKIPFKTHGLPDGGITEDANITRAILRELMPNVVIVDHHNINQAYLDSIKPFTDLLVTIDDLKREICADVVVNVNFFSLRMHYACKKGKVFLGPKYALIKKIVPRNGVRKRANRILVSVGGADVLNITPKVISALREIGEITITVVIGPAFTNEKEIYNAIAGDKRFSVTRTKDLPNLMLKHDTAICGGGTTLYELAATGTPAIILCQAENQFINAGELNGKTLISLGMGNSVNIKKIKMSTDGLLKDYNLRKSFSNNGKRLVDCNGPQRIEKIILTELEKRKLELKPATKKDAKDLWKWRNEKTARMNSFNTRIIPFGEHMKWLSNVLNNNKKRIFIIYNNKRKIGFARIDKNGHPEINIGIAKPYRKLGFGSRAITLACLLINNKNITARIKPENLASIKAFQKAGFDVSEKAPHAVTMKLAS